MTTALGNPQVLSAKKPSCADFPQVFSSSYLEDFDEVAFLESKEDEGIENEEAILLIDSAKTAHDQIQPRAIAAAKDICATCPLLEECRDWVLSIKDQTEVYGVVAGMTLSERRSARRVIARQNSKSLRSRSSVTIPASIDSGDSQKINETAQRLLHTR